MLENSLINYCAPTLAGIKCANLFNFFFEDVDKAYKEVAVLNGMLKDRGVYLEVLLERHDNLLVYAYRKKHLDAILERVDVQLLLYRFGYRCFDTQACIDALKTRLLVSSTFPHEIGVFLGYPVEDVKCFIKYKGENCKLCGMWKVYCNVDECKKLFRQYDECTAIYKKHYSFTNNIQNMIVCV